MRSTSSHTTLTRTCCLLRSLDLSAKHWQLSTIRSGQFLLASVEPHGPTMAHSKVKILMMDCACSHAHPSSDVLPACSPGPNHFTWARFQVQPVKPHSRRHIHKLLAQLFLFWSSVNLWVTCVPFFPYSTSNERRAPKVETNFAAHQPSQFNDTFLSQQSLSNYSPLEKP